MSNNKIIGFKDEYSFLSNFYNHTVKVNGLFYRNNVAAYIAQLYTNKQQQRYFTKLLPSAAIRLHESTHVDIPADWDSKKEQIMYNICKNKFSSVKMRELLLSTGDKELVNESNFANEYWGTKDGKGENVLGKILMRLRQEFKDNPVDNSVDNPQEAVDNMTISEAPTLPATSIANDSVADNSENSESIAENSEIVQEEKPSKKKKNKKNENDTEKQAKADS